MTPETDASAHGLVGGIFAENAHHCGSGERLPIFGPSTACELLSLPAAGPDDDALLGTAERAFRRAWSVQKARDRGEHLRHLADAFARHAEDLARVESPSTRKPLPRSCSEPWFAGNTLRRFAGT